MMNSNLQDIMREASKYSDNIISNITNILSSNNVKYKMLNDNEITILDDVSDTDIRQMIFNDINIPHTQLLMLIEVVNIDNNIYIRQVMQ